MISGFTGQPQTELSFTKKRDLTVTDLLQIAKRRRKIFYFFTILMVLGSLIRSVLYIPTYMAQSTISVKVPTRTAITDLAGETSQDTAADLIKKYLRYLKSSTYYLSMAETLKFKDEYNQLNLSDPRGLSYTNKEFWKHIFHSRTSKNLEDSNLIHGQEPVLIPVEQLGPLLQDLTVVDSDGTSTIMLKVTTLDAKTSMILANTAAEAFIKLTSEHDYNEVNEIRQFVEKLLKQTTEHLKLAELDLVAFKKKNHLITIDTEHKAYADRLSHLETELENAKIQKEQNDRLIRFYEVKLSKVENGPVAEPFNDIGALKMKLDTLRKQQQLLGSEGYSETSKQAVDVDNAIKNTSARLKELVSKGVSRAPEEPSFDAPTAREKIDDLKKSNKILETQIVTIVSARDKLLASLNDLPEDEQTLIDLNRKATLQFELYSNLNKRLQELEIQKFSTNSHVSIDELSGIPPKVAQPSVIIGLVFALLSGLFFGAVLSLALELLDPTVKSRGDLEEFELYVMGEIPKIEESKLRKNMGISIFRPDLLVCKEQPQSNVAMDFKYLRTQLRQCTVDDGKPAQVVTITSPELGDGKSLIAANLAISNAQLNTGKKTLIVDCDLRSPKLARYFGYEPRAGLTSLLTMNALLEDVIIRDIVPNLDIIPAGHPHDNPSEIIGDDKLIILLDYLRTEYDHIILDAPAVLSVVDATVLASLADIVILVCSYRTTRKDSVLKAHQRIIQICHRRAFAVLNRVPQRFESQQTPYLLASARRRRSGLAGDLMDQEKAHFKENLRSRKAG